MHRLLIRGFLAFTIALAAPAIHAQEVQQLYQQWIEFLTENLDGTEEFDFTEFGEILEGWIRHPLDINGEDVRLLVDWRIINEITYNRLQDHIARHGPLISMLELQSVPGFTAETVRLLQSVATVRGRDEFTRSAPLAQQFFQGTNEMYIRGGRYIQDQRGFIGDGPAYEGSPDKVYMRYRHKYGNALSYGFTTEKDAGESLLNPGNNGFDYVSAHIALRDYKPWLPALMLGDYSISMGQGLIQHAGFGGGKSSFVTSIKRSGTPLRPYSSVDENNFMRGVGATFKPTDRIAVTVFGSTLRRDGNLISDTLFEGVEEPIIIEQITSLQTSGQHRTASEIADEDIVRYTQAGAVIGYKYKRLSLNVNALHTSLDKPLNRSLDLYNQFYFNGDQLTNVSLDYGFSIKGIHLFGETAWSDNNAFATINGLLAALDRRVSLAILFRSYDKSFHSIYPNSFGEGSLANNETGLYTGLSITPSAKWKIDLYHDMWKHPWLRFNVDSPTEGQEYFGRITYTLKRRLDIYAQFRYKQNNFNTRATGDAIAEVAPQIKTQARLQFNNILDKATTLRTRLEWTTYELKDEQQNGFMIYQDVLIHPIGSPWTFNARVGLFDTDAYDTRIYTYENDLIYYYAIPAFSDQGVRYYFHVRYKGIRNLTLEIKFAETRYRNREMIGSGNDEIIGNRRSEIRGQVIYRWGEN